MAYLRRVIDNELDELVPDLAAIALDGARGVGKTATAQRRADAVFRLDQSSQQTLVAADPSLVLREPGLKLIDEWQAVPPVWDVVRRQVDRDNTGGQFLLTGNAKPRPGATAHTGAGRIARLRMRPMTLLERGFGEPQVSLAGLLTGDRPDIYGKTSLSLVDYVEEILASGLPGIRVLTPRGRRAQLSGYLEGVIDREIIENGIVVKKPAVLLGWMKAYAAATATTTSYSRILDAATPGQSDKPTRVTADSYRDALANLWILDQIPGWLPTFNNLKRLQQAPKHHLADPALAARLLDATSESLLRGGGRTLSTRDGTLLGQLFESLATLCVRVPAQAAEATVSHLRTRNGDHEVDLIISPRAGLVLGIEVKLTSAVRDDDVRHLHWLRNQIGEDLLDAVVLYTGPYAYRRKDGIAVVPLALLGP